MGSTKFFEWMPVESQYSAMQLRQFLERILLDKSGRRVTGNWSTPKFRKNLDFRFPFAYSAGRKRKREPGGAPPPLPIRLSRVGRRPLKVPSRKRGEGSTCKTIPRSRRPIRDVP